MGCAASRGVNPIDAALLQALIEAKKRRARSRQTLTFNELLLKFPKMAVGFKKCRQYFDMLDVNGDRLIDMGEFTSQAHKLGLEMDLEDLKNVFDAADIDHSTKIDVFEFVLVFVVVHLLSPEHAACLPQEIRTTLEITEEAFCCFDASEDGYLEREEVEKALTTTSTPGRATRALSDKLFAQLDFDGSGGISFKEFLIGLEKMVMEEYCEDDEDESETAARQAEERQLMTQAARMRQLKQQQQQRHGNTGGSGKVQQRQPGSPYQISAAANAHGHQSSSSSKGGTASSQRRSMEQQPGRH